MDITNAILKLEDGCRITRAGIGDWSITKISVANDPKKYAVIEPNNLYRSSTDDVAGAIVYLWTPNEEDIKATDWKIVENKVWLWNTKKKSTNLKVGWAN